MRVDDEQDEHAEHDQRERQGALAHELYVVISTPTGDEKAVKASLEAHLAYQAEEESAGSLAFAGPLSDETGQLMNGVGMIVYRADSLDVARALAEADPMHVTGARSFTTRRWLINKRQPLDQHQALPAAGISGLIPAPNVERSRSARIFTWRRNIFEIDDGVDRREFAN